MKKRHLAGTAGLLLLALWTTACSTSSNNATESRYSNSSSKKVKDAASGSNDRGFVGNRYTTNNGSISIDKITNVKVNDQYRNLKNFTMVILEGTFTNKSSKPVSPKEWALYNLEVNQVLSNSERELVPGSDEADNGTKWEELLRNGDSKVLPGKTIKFAIEYDLDYKTAKVTEDYSIQARNTEDNSPLGSPYKLKAGMDNFTYHDTSYEDASSNWYKLKR